MNAITKAAGTSIQNERFEGQEIEQRYETATSATEMRARAEIEAQYIVAVRRPRSVDTMRIKVLAECARTSFASRALYSLPRKKWDPELRKEVTVYIEGLTVRFAETALRLFGNVKQDSTVTYEDDIKRILKVRVTDLETNTIYEREVIVSKTVERKKVYETHKVIGERMNSDGNRVFIVESTEDELRQKEGALVSKTFRTLALRLIPADILEDAEGQVRATRAAETASDPAAARKKTLDAFATIGVLPDALTSYLAHDLASCSPAELEHLRGLYAAIKDGSITWAQALAEKVGDVDAGKVESDTPKANGATVQARIEEAKQKRQKKPDAPKDEPKAADKADRCHYCKEIVGIDAVEIEGPEGEIVLKHPNCTAFGKGASPR